MTFRETLTNENQKSYDTEFFSSLEPRSYFITGIAGCGKTFTALQIVKELLRKNPVKAEYINNKPNENSNLLAPQYESEFFEFVKAQDIIRIAKQQYSDSQTEKHEAKMAIKSWKTREVLIIDDLGAENTTEFAKTTLFELIDYRYDNRDSNITIITSNVSVDDLTATYSDRTTSRILATCKPISFENQTDLRNINKI